ncbi:hypothetical protein FKM82_017821 [Ascaphus truei]
MYSKHFSFFLFLSSGLTLVHCKKALNEKLTKMSNFNFRTILCFITTSYNGSEFTARLGVRCESLQKCIVNKNVGYRITSLVG